MTRLRTALLAALLWCGVVAVVATLVWVVISRAGQGVVPMSQPQADVTESLPVPGDHGPRVRASPGVTLAPRPSPSAKASSSATTSPLAPPPSPTSSAPPASSPSTQPAAAPRAQRRSWSGSAGHVVAECRGPSAELVSAFPNAGWRYTIVSRGPAQVRVRFTRTGGDDRSVTVDARCVSGVPHFGLPHDDGPADE